MAITISTLRNILHEPAQHFKTLSIVSREHDIIVSHGVIEVAISIANFQRAVIAIPISATDRQKLIHSKHYTLLKNELSYTDQSGDINTYDIFIRILNNNEPICYNDISIEDIPEYLEDIEALYSPYSTSNDTERPCSSKDTQPTLDFYEDRAIIEQDKKFGVVDTTYQIIIEPLYDNITYNTEASIFIAYDNSSITYFDYNGNIIDPNIPQLKELINSRFK